VQKFLLFPKEKHTAIEQSMKSFIGLLVIEIGMQARTRVLALSEPIDII